MWRNVRYRHGAPASAAARLEFSTGAITNFSDAMESGANGWTVSHSGGSVDWTQVTTTSHTATHSWFGTDQAIVTDLYLKSPSIAISSGAQLSFWHSFALE